jgi:hypothetical protein
MISKRQVFVVDVDLALCRLVRTVLPTFDSPPTGASDAP